MLYFKPPPPKQSLSSKNRERRQLNIKNKSNNSPVSLGSELDGTPLSPIKVLQPLSGSKIENKMWHSINEKTVTIVNNETLKLQATKFEVDDSINRNNNVVNDATKFDIKNNVISNQIPSTIEIKMWRSLNQNIAPVFTAPNQNSFFSKGGSSEGNKSPLDRIVKNSTDASAPYDIPQHAQNADIIGKRSVEVTGFHTTHVSSGNNETAITTTPSRGSVMSRRRLLGKDEVHELSPAKAVSTASRKSKKNRQSVVVHIEQPKRTTIDTPPVLSSHGDRRRTQTPLKSRNHSSTHDRQKAVVESDKEITIKFAIKYVADLFSLSRYHLLCFIQYCNRCVHIIIYHIYTQTYIHTYTVDEGEHNFTVCPFVFQESYLRNPYTSYPENIFVSYCCQFIKLSNPNRTSTLMDIYSLKYTDVRTFKNTYTHTYTVRS